MKRKPIHRILKRYTKPSTRRITHLVHLRSSRDSLCCSLEVVLGFYHKCCTTKLIHVRFFEAVDKRVWSVASIVSLLANSSLFRESEVLKEFAGFLRVGVLVIDMCGTHQHDLLRSVGTHDGDVRYTRSQVRRSKAYFE